MADAITATGIRKSFGSTQVLSDISITIPKGSVYCILGPNGSGKTTLLNLLAGSTRPDAGSIQRHGTVGYCHQVPLLYADLSVRQNLELFSELVDAKKDSVSGIAQMLGLNDVLDKRATTLSSGMKKRLELAIALLPDPDILILDEPTTGLDSESAEGLVSFIKQIAGKKTIVLATHQLSDIKGLCTGLLTLKEGKQTYQGSGKPRDSEKNHRKIIK